MKIFKLFAALVALALFGGGAFVYLGVFDVAADRRHWPLTEKLIAVVRERSIAVQARDIQGPDLEDAALLLAGGPDYNEMCAGCHLQPGRKDSEMSLGLYPAPPNLARAEDEHGHVHDEDPKARAARQFWIVKHGLKMTGMPAWGLTHDDARIWAMVAFLQKLPRLTPEQYQILTARGEGEAGHGDHGEAHMHGTEHGEHAPDGAAAPVPTSPLATVEAFHEALQSADRKRATGLLAPDVLIYESGGAERSRDAYLAHHMKEDMAFLGTAKVDLIKRSVRKRGDTATVNSETRIRGKAGDAEVDVLSTETAVLAKTGEGWRITHLHWSSRPFEPPAPHSH